ncbi:MAG TPA: SRPBCC family protein [Candidatus Sulfotelmatobacter sp.]|nr:SRPBCC family protein [Candidatus Sulfotelmatobacter sp.]
MPQVVRSLEIQAQPRAVWFWLATQEALRRWISSSLEIDLRVGGAYRFLGPDHKTWVSGTVLELQPERSLVLSWLEEGSGWAHPARLVIMLAPSAAGTRVTLIHDGFEHIGRSDWADTLQDYERGADAHRILDRLAGLVTAGDAQQCK